MSPSALSSRSTVTRLFGAADIAIDGHRPWDIRVTDERFFHRIFKDGSLGFGESYMAGWWQTDDLEELSYRLSRSGLHLVGRALPAHLMKIVFAAARNQQTPELSTRVIDRHYDLGNDLFTSFLGTYKNYSCGYYAGTSSLDEAQLQKMDLVCRKLQLRESDHLLDVGGGWGQFAYYAATKYGCRVTSINISDEQLAYARELCSGLPVDVRKCDYRDLTGDYDKIAVIAMLTHVGPKNYRKFMQIMHGCLHENGMMLIESIGGRVAKKNCEPWIDKYIFPGGVIPSRRQLTGAAKGLLEPITFEEFGQYYVFTLRAWHHNLMDAWPDLAPRYSETTRLMLEYFFLAAAGVFRVGHLKHWHILLSRTGHAGRA